MCTVTYIPQPQNGFILTSNRDETAARSPRNLTKTDLYGQTLIFPRDTGAGGTWLVASNHNRVVCLLNGAFEKHQHQPPYKKSRGIMVLEYFSFSQAEAFFETYDFQGIEPFTMIILEREQLWEFRWDEQQTYVAALDGQGSYIWSSATLYGPAIRAQRQAWFDAWRSGRTDFSQPAILDFHQQGGEKDDWNGFVMNRNNLVQTVSISSIAKTSEEIQLRYHSLVHQEIKNETLLLSK